MEDIMCRAADVAMGVALEEYAKNAGYIWLLAGAMVLFAAIFLIYHVFSRDVADTILLVGATALHTLLVPTAFLVSLFIAAAGIPAQGPVFIAELMFPSACVWFACIYYVIAPKSARHISFNILALHMILIAFPCILMHVYFLSPSAFGGNADVLAANATDKDSCIVRVLFKAGVVAALVGNSLALFAFACFIRHAHAAGESTPGPTATPAAAPALDGGEPTDGPAGVPDIVVTPAQDGPGPRPRHRRRAGSKMQNK